MKYCEGNEYRKTFNFEFVLERRENGALHVASLSAACQVSLLIIEFMPS